MSLDRACRAHSGHVRVATWNCRKITSESSSVFRMAFHRMTSRVFALLTPGLVSRSSQAVSIAEPWTPTVKLHWAVVQVVPCLRDAHLIYSRWRAYLVSFSRSLSCAQSRDQSAPCTSRFAPMRHLWSPLVLCTPDRHISWLSH